MVTGAASHGIQDSVAALHWYQCPFRFRYRPLDARSVNAHVPPGPTTTASIGSLPPASTRRR